jgi:hypothetical protein
MELQRLKAATATRLTLGRDFLAWNQWTKHKTIRRLSDGTYAYCASGALQYGAFASPPDEFTFPEENEIYEACCYALDNAAERLTGKPMHFQLFNDRVAQDREEIIALYDNAINELTGDPFDPS